MAAPRLKERYRSEIVPELMKALGLKNPHQAPRLDKVIINMGVGEAVRDGKALDAAMQDLSVIAGQKPLIVKAKKSVASFRLREGMAIGTKVTLRGDKMYEFMDRLISLALPRIRDFRGLSLKSFDGRGNYSLGITDQIVFPEIDYDNVTRTQGMDITIVTTANSNKECEELLRALGMPLKS